MYTSKLGTKLFLRALILLSVVAYANSALAETKKQKIEYLMKYSHANGLFSGSVLVAENGKVIYSDAFGLANETTGTPLTTASQFYLASVSKQFTSMAIMILKEQGKLSFQDKLSKFFPDFPAYAEGVTVEHLMAHTAGIADPFKLGMYKNGLKNHEVLKALMQQDSLEFSPGEKYSYSNGGYILLALIVEKVSGQSFHSFMNKYIFRPLKMNSSLVYDESRRLIVNRVIGYNESGDIDDYNLLTYGAGGIYSTVEDLFKWDRALHTQRLVTDKTLERAFSPFKLADGTSSNYGYGWKIAQAQSNTIVSHSGVMGGFRAMIDRQLKPQNTIIMLTNQGDSFAAGAITLAIRNILNDKVFELPVR